MVANLTRMSMKFDSVSESSSEYNSSVDYEHEHRPPRRTEYRFAEYEHEYDEIRCEARTKRSPRPPVGLPDRKHSFIS